MKLNGYHESVIVLIMLLRVAVNAATIPVKQLDALTEFEENRRLVRKGIVYTRVEADGTIEIEAYKFYTQEVLQQMKAKLRCETVFDLDPVRDDVMKPHVSKSLCEILRLKWVLTVDCVIRTSLLAFG